MDGRSLIIAADHRQRGLQQGMEDFQKLSRDLASAMRSADALIATKEPIAHLIAEQGTSLRSKGLVLSLNRTGLAGSAFEMDDRLVASTEVASGWGLDGAKFLLRIDPKAGETSAQLEACGRICEECERLELPIILEPLYCHTEEGSVKISTSAEHVGYAAIIAGDFAPAAIKIPYPDARSRTKARAAFRDIVNSVGCRVLVLGGRKVALRQLLARAEDSVCEGGRGLVVGRNILLQEDPALATAALRLVVHGGMDSETALRQASKEMPD